MADIPNELAKKGLEKLMDWAIGEARYICCFTSIVADCEKEKEILEAKVKAVGQRVDQLKRSSQDTPADVTSWDKRADKLIQEDTKTKKTCFFGWCPNCIWRYNRGKELANKTEDARRINQELENLNITGLTPHLLGVEYHSSQDYISFKSRELIYNELLDALTDDNYITGLQGMGGTGKTTLARKVGQELEQSKQFDHVIDTTVSYTPDIRKIQDDIAVPLGLASELKDKSESERCKLLRSRLTNGEKILLILDDVWENTVEHIKFEKIGIPKSDDHKGCRVLLTTRDLNACRSLGCEKIIELQLLPEDEAWTLFEKHAHISSSTPKSLMDKGHEIVKECKGLPVAIAIIASRLKGEQRQVQWNAALISLQKPMHGVNKDLNEIYKCLWYSYDNMNNEEAKRLFLLCSVFPEDEELPTEVLTRFGIGAGLFGEVYDKYDDVRIQVAVAKNELIDSCLLLKAEGGRVKMHDLVREVALLKVNKEIRAVNLSGKHKKSLVESEKGMKYLLLEGNEHDVFSYRFDGSELEILKINCMVEEDSMEMPNSFFENMAKLRVLYLSCQHWGRPLSLLQSIESLTNIRSLFLERLRLGDISILGKLRSLEALDLVYCEVVELPREIAELERLRLLNLDGCEIEMDTTFDVIERCSSLEELYFTKFKVDSSSIHKKITLPALQRYHIRDGYDDETYDSVSKYVCASYIDTYFSEATFKYLVQTTEILKLTGIEGEWRNLIPEIVPIDDGMNYLVKLRLESWSKLQCLIDTSHINFSEQNFFSKLAVLELDEMENLEELSNGPLPFDFLKSLETLLINDCNGLGSILLKSKLNLYNLKTIKLWHCPKLVTLFQLLTSQSLLRLEELEIMGCEQLVNIIADERTGENLGDEIVGVDNGNKRRNSHAPMFSNLKTLYISYCPLLEFIIPVLSARDIPALESITIEYCDELKYIFGKYQHENEELDLHQEVKDVVLTSLDKMELTGLPNFIDIFPECYHPKRSSPKRSSSKSQMQSDPMKCNIFPWTHKYRHKLRSTTSAQIPLVSKDQLQHSSISSASNHLWERAECLSKQPQMLRNIKEIDLWDLSKIESVFIMSNAPTMMLETLTIEYCDNLKHIIIDTGDDRGGNNWGDVFPKLEKILVKRCELLESVFGHYPHDHQNQSEIHLQLPALKFLNFFKLPNLIGICSKNYSTSLPLLTEFTLGECSQFSIKSFGDLSVHDSRELGSTTIKDLSGNVRSFLTLEKPKIYNSKEINEQQMQLRLQKFQLGDQPQMTYIFVGPKNSCTLQNLEELTIARCEKLEVIFSAAILRYLPQLHKLIITECKELKQIIEKDVEYHKMSNFLSSKIGFPKLTILVVNKCDKLKCIFPVSTSKEFPKLENVIIKEAYELEQVFEYEQSDQKVELPNLKFAVFVKLPSLYQRIEFETAISLFIQSCPKLSLTSTTTIDKVQRLTRYVIKEFGDWFLKRVAEDMVDELDEEDSNNKDTINQNPIAEITEEVSVGPDVQAASGCELICSHVDTDQQEDDIESNEFLFVETKSKQSLEEEQEFVEKVPGLEIPTITISPTDSEVIRRPCPSPLDIPLHESHSHELVDEQNMVEPCLMNQQHLLGETDITFKSLQGNNFLKETEDQAIQKDSTSEKTVKETLSTDSETRSTSLGPLLPPQEKSIKRSVEGATSANSMTPTSSTHSESVSSLPGTLVTSEHKTHSPVSLLYANEHSNMFLCLNLMLPCFQIINCTKGLDLKESMFETTLMEEEELRC
ncbi:uncharacterized protein LOC133300484 [Gastrolobium bilobum]|uniref:uncharacterized protein LOC133300484 n=1 Tax=Gastrolobium bilobum TaxID=150636 RepID=UPI002AAF56B6|nr:uncharacterized protein LOC133300484 [Gastrolobium bilobum]